MQLFFLPQELDGPNVSRAGKKLNLIQLNKKDRTDYIQILPLMLTQQELLWIALKLLTVISVTEGWLNRHALIVSNKTLFVLFQNFYS